MKITYSEISITFSLHGAAARDQAVRLCRTERVASPSSAWAAGKPGEPRQQHSAAGKSQFSGHVDSQ